MAENPKLIILSEQFRGQTFELTGSEYTVGRSDDCDIPVPGSTLSGHHCTLKRTEDGAGYVAVDEGSTNGTRVNGVLVDEQKLVNTDILQLGNVEILYDSPESTPTESSSTKTGINLNEDTAQETAVNELTNFSPFQSKGGAGVPGFYANKTVTYGVAGFLGLTGIAALALLVWFVLELTG